ncbi:MAG: hypothetical protein KA035_02845 [Candidatus Levybacteria bacterium]|nr:hypothetical protein [Candidatus Levybacteria bacterium]
MAEVIHEHVAHDTSSSNAMGFIMGIAVLVVLAILAFYFFGASGIFGGVTNNVDTGSSAPQVDVPRQVDVNVNK